MKKVLKWVGIVVLGLFLLGAIFGESEETETVANENIAESQQESEPVSTEVKEEPKEEKIDVVNEENKEKEPSLTLAQQNAIGAAENYLNYTAFSKEGLIEQLEYEKFSNEDARFAVENIVVDWKEQAVKAGKDYLDYSAFSRSGLIEQLIYEGFTKEQATYAVNQIGL